MFPSFVWFKSKEVEAEWAKMQPTLQKIALEMGRFFLESEYQLIITDIMSDAAEDQKLHRVSTTHREGRAFDFRVHGLPKEFLDEVENKFENLYKELAALSLENGKPNLILYHNNGNGMHAHVQIRRGV